MWHAATQKRNNKYALVYENVSGCHPYDKWAESRGQRKGAVLWTTSMGNIWPQLHHRFHNSNPTRPHTHAQTRTRKHEYPLRMADWYLCICIARSDNVCRCRAYGRLLLSVSRFAMNPNAMRFEFVDAMSSEALHKHNSKKLKNKRRWNIFPGISPPILSGCHHVISLDHVAIILIIDMMHRYDA